MSELAIFGGARDDHAECSRAIAARVSREIGEAESKLGKGYASAHEAFGVLLEEVEEFKAEVWLKQAKRDRHKMIRELVQVAAVAQRFAAQLLEGHEGSP